MAGSIFREKSMERVSSPEQLSDYIRVSTPPVWIVLIASILLIAGALIWSIFGSLQLHDAQGNPESVAPVTFVIN